MNENENLVPKRRFKEFTNTGTWETRKLEEVSKVYDGTHQTPNYTDSGVMFLSVENIKTLNSKKFISEEAFEKDFKIHPQKGDILMTRIGDIGTANVIQSNEPVAYYVSLALLKPIGIESNFLATSIATPFVQDGLWKRTLHIAFPKKINKNEIAKVEINVPSLQEQIKIGTFFKQLDNTISLHQSKLNKTKELKAAYLSEMFPSEGKSKPKRRFAEFSNDWEQRQLIEVADMFDNLRVPVTASNRIKGDTPYYGANGIQDYVNGFTHEGEFVLIAEDGANDLINYPVQYVRGKIWVNNHAHVVSGKAEELDNLFLTACIKAMNISSVLVGGGRAKLNGEVLKNIPIKIPVYDEQKEIGNFFKQLDNTIDLHQHRLEKLQNIKKAYLNEMFV